MSDNMNIHEVSHLLTTKLKEGGVRLTIVSWKRTFKGDYPRIKVIEHIDLYALDNKRIHMVEGDLIDACDIREEDVLSDNDDFKLDG